MAISGMFCSQEGGQAKNVIQIALCMLPSYRNFQLSSAHLFTVLVSTLILENKETHFFPTHSIFQAFWIPFSPMTVIQFPVD